MIKVIRSFPRSHSLLAGFLFLTLTFSNIYNSHASRNTNKGNAHPLHHSGRRSAANAAATATAAAAQPGQTTPAPKCSDTATPAHTPIAGASSGVGVRGVPAATPGFCGVALILASRMLDTVSGDRRR